MPKAPRPEPTPPDLTRVAVVRFLGAKPAEHTPWKEDMQISLRSHLAAGTTAAVAATLVIAPGNVALQGLPALPALTASAAAEVTLAAFNSPLGQLIGTGELLQNYIFGVFYNGGDSPTPGAGEANWPYAGFDQTGGLVLNYLLYNEDQLGNYSAVGIIPQRINDAEPVQRQLQTNWSNYINVALTQATIAAGAIDTGIWTFPQALVSAAELALSGDIPGAIQVLGQAVVTPIAQATEAVFDAVGYIVSSVIAKLAAVVGTIPPIVTTFVGYAVRGLSLLAEQAVGIGTTVINDVTSGNFEGAWNTAVDGLLGPSGLPGSVINLNLGAGVQTGPILTPTPADIEANFAPSLRTAIQGALWRVQDALTTPPAAGASEPAPSAAAARTAEPGALESTTDPASGAASATPAGEKGSAAGTRSSRPDRDTRGRAASKRDTTEAPAAP